MLALFMWKLVPFCFEFLPLMPGAVEYLQRSLPGADGVVKTHWKTMGSLQMEGHGPMVPL